MEEEHCKSWPLEIVIFRLLIYFRITIIKRQKCRMSRNTRMFNFCYEVIIIIIIIIISLFTNESNSSFSKSRRDFIF